MTRNDPLKQRINHFEVPSAGISECADRLRGRGFRVCSFDEGPGVPKQPFSAAAATLSELLERIVRSNPGYRWDEPMPGLINLFPRVSILDEPVPTLDVRAKGAWRALEEDLGLGRFGISHFQEFGDPDGPNVDLNLRDADLRAALNAIVAQLDPLVWHVTGTSGAYLLSFTEVPTPAS